MELTCLIMTFYTQHMLMTQLSFLKELDSIKNVLEMLNQFYYKVSTGLRLNFSKCEIAGIGSLKDAKLVLCGLKSLDLTKESIKILGVHISCNKKLQDDINLCTTVKNICNVIKLWCMRHLSQEGKITIFKFLVLSKIVHLALLTLRELIFAGINFHEFREFLTISRKLVPAKIIGDCATREFRES